MSRVEKGMEQVLNYSLGLEPQDDVQRQVEILTIHADRLISLIHEKEISLEINSVHRKLNIDIKRTDHRKE